MVFSLSPARTTLAAGTLSLDVLLGGQGRANHLKRIEKLVFDNSRTFVWEDFSNWGREIFLNGFVKNPPPWGPTPRSGYLSISPVQTVTTVSVKIQT
jgi:hypothetical protein